VKTHAFGYDWQTNVTAIGRYDANGLNVTQSVCLRHDALGRLVMVGTKKTASFSPDAIACTKDTDVGTVLARFKYDSRNRRIARWLASTGQWTYFANGPDGSVLAEVTLTSDPGNPWAPARGYVWLDGRSLAQVERSGGGADRYYYHLDHIGLPRALTNGAGQVVWSATPARPYGDLVETVTPDPLTGRTVVTNVRLPGQYDERLLGSLGLQGPYYNWNRWYLPGAGRYLELDAIAVGGGLNGEWGPDWYAYALGNPLIYVDPFGLQTEEALGMARRRVAQWILDLFLEWTLGNAATALCIDDACDTRHRKDYFEAYGYCLVAIVKTLKAPPGLLGQDQFVSYCARQCRAITHSKKFDDNCLGPACR